MSKVRIRETKALGSTLIPILLLSGLLVFPALAASSWSRPRPSSDLTYGETIGNAYTDSIASVGMGVTIGKYSENDPGYGNNDHLSLRISASANTREDIHYDVWSSSYNWYSVTNPLALSTTMMALGLVFLLLFSITGLSTVAYG